MNGTRNHPIEMGKEEFRKIGHELVDTIADFIGSFDQRPVTYGQGPSQIQKHLGNHSLPDKGMPTDQLIAKTSELLINNSLFNGHPKFLGYITSSATPIGALADLLAASVNPNCGAHLLSPVATEIEKQTVQWLAEFIGVAPSCGGILVSGGNMANFTGFLAGRTAQSAKELKTRGLRGLDARQTVYCSKTTHTWIEKATILFGMGSDSVRWIPTDATNRMKIEVLKETIEKDRAQGLEPIMVIGTAGDVSTGAVDDLQAIASICETKGLWFHVDGAYGVPAAVIPENKELFSGLEKADSIALDPHKWLYSPLEAGCTLVKDPKHLTDTFSSHPDYYKFSSEEGEFAQNFYEYGLQNSRGFRALKVWLGLQQMGRTGYRELIAEDIRLAQVLFQLAEQHPELHAVSQNLSISTLRYIPPGIDPEDEDPQDYLNQLNETLVEELQLGGEVFLSNAIIEGKYCLRGCIVNFRTSEKDIEEIIEIVVGKGREVWKGLRAKA